MKEKTVLFIANKGYPVRGGAQIANIAFCKHLSTRFGCRCSIFTEFPCKKVIRHKGVRISVFRDTEELKSMIRDFAPDVIISATDEGSQVVRIAGIYNIPVIAYMHSFEYCPPDPREKERWKVSTTKEYASGEQIKALVAAADTVVVNSRFLSDRFKRRHGADTTVIYPEFIAENIPIADKAGKCGKYITGVCGFAYKGAEIFLYLAKKFREQKFLLAGNVDHRYLAAFRGLDNVTVLGFASAKKMLGMSGVVVVPSQWPEPFGRVAIEAMANGIPVLASLTGGLVEVLSGTSIGVRRFREKRAWEKSLGELILSEKAREKNWREGRKKAQIFMVGRSSEKLFSLIESITARKKPDFKAKKTVAILGNIEKNTAHALINARWVEMFKRARKVRIVDVPGTSSKKYPPADCYIHHDYFQDFKKVCLPDEGKFVAVRTWDFGNYPRAWVDKINAECDQLWVYSSWTKKKAVKSGISPGQIKVVPHGIDEKIFTSYGKKYVLDTKKKFRFIFTGAPVIRKGIDVLLRAYYEAFDPEEDVCLVIKDNPREKFYSGETFRDRLRALAADKNQPEIAYIDKYLSEREMASLYRACNVGVFPYRAEGFAMPILEAMACGVPSIVPYFGACLDFCLSNTAFLMPAKRINLPVVGDFAINTLGFREEVEEVDFCEVSVEVLAQRMRRVYALPRATLRSIGKRGARYARENFKWRDSFKKIEAYLRELDQIKVPRRLRMIRTERCQERKKFEAAKALFLEMEPR